MPGPRIWHAENYAAGFETEMTFSDLGRLARSTGSVLWPAGGHAMHCNIKPNQRREIIDMDWEYGSGEKHSHLSTDDPVEIFLALIWAIGPALDGAE